MALNENTREGQADASREALAQRRKNARRTAIVLGGVALAIFVTFLVTGITGRG